MGSDAIDIAGIAALAEVTTASVYGWRERYDDFPRPLDDKAVRGVTYDVDEVKAFLTRHMLGARFAEVRPLRRGRPPIGVTRRRPKPSSPPFDKDDRVVREAERHARIDALIGEATAIVALALADRGVRTEAELVDEVRMATRSARDGRDAGGAANAAMHALNNLTQQMALRDPGLRELLRPDRPMGIASLRAIRAVAEDPSAAPEALSRVIGQMRAPGPWRNPQRSMPPLALDLALAASAHPPHRLLLPHAGDGEALVRALADGIDVIWAEPDPDLAHLIALRAAVEHGRARPDGAVDGASREFDLVLDAPFAPRSGSDWLAVLRQRRRVAPGGRLVAVIPAPALVDDDPDLGELVRSGAVEAVLDVLGDRGIIRHALLVVLPEGVRATRILFGRAEQPGDPAAVRTALAAVRAGNEPVTDDEQPGAPVWIVTPVDEVAAGTRIDLTPAHWTSRRELGDPVRAFKRALAAQEQVDASLRGLQEAIADARAVSFARTRQDGVDRSRPLADLMRHRPPLVERIAAQATADRRMSMGPMSSTPPVARLWGRETVRLDGKPVALDAPEGVARQQILTNGDVVVWSTGATAFRTFIAEGLDPMERLVAYGGARVLRVTDEGREAGLTPELLAFLVEASERWIERAAARQMLGEVRVPVKDPDEPVLRSVARAAERFGATAGALAALRRAETDLTIAASRVGYLRIVLAEYGGAGTLEATGPPSPPTSR